MYETSFSPFGLTVRSGRGVVGESPRAHRRRCARRFPGLTGRITNGLCLLNPVSRGVKLIRVGQLVEQGTVSGVGGTHRHVPLRIISASGFRAGAVACITKTLNSIP